MERQTAINYYKSKGLKKITPVSITIGVNEENPANLHEPGTAFWGNIIVSYATQPGEIRFILTLEDDAEILILHPEGRGNYESYYIAFDKIKADSTTDTFITFQGLQFKK